MILEKELTEIGFSSKEAKAYLALLRLGSQPASVIAKELGLSRSTAQFILETLVKKQFANKVVRKKIFYYTAEPPENLKIVVDLQKNVYLKKLEDKKKKIDILLPEFSKIRRSDLLFPKIKYYEGLQGIKRVYEDTLSEGETIYAFEDIGEFSPELKTWLYDNYIPRRVEKEIFAYVITPKNPDNVSYRKKDKTAHKETRFVPKANFPIDIEINIYDEKTAFFSHKPEEMFAAILESKSIANSMKSIFNLCWKIAR